MINNVVLMGRITHDLELNKTTSGRTVLSFSLAIARNYVKEGEERKSDFITCIAWDKQAEFVKSYFAKGKMIAVTGSFRSRQYEDKRGSIHYVTEVYTDSVSFTGEAKEKSVDNTQPTQTNVEYKQISITDENPAQS